MDLYYRLGTMFADRQQFELAVEQFDHGHRRIGHVEGQKLPDLPPSVAAQFASPNSNLQKAALNRITLWETNFPVEGTFSGQKIMPVRIE